MNTNTPAESADITATPAAPEQAKAPALSARALLKQLQQEFPAFRDCLPLAIGIDRQLLARMPGLDRTPGAEVTDTHRLHAKEQLQERFKTEAERKKAEREAAAAEEANRKRQEKLQALASKFSRN